MNDEAYVNLIRQIVRNYEEFIHENNPEQFSSDEEVECAFLRFSLRKKEKQTEGGAQ